MKELKDYEYYRTDLGVQYCGNHLDVLPLIKNVDMTLTSPPYDDLRKYEGYSFEFNSLARELYRIINIGGVCVWIVGDMTIDGSETGTSFKQALYFKEIGFNLHDTMIYESEKPPLTHNRYEQKFEYMFIFSKGKPKIFNPIKEKCIYINANLNRPKTSKGSRSQNSAIRSRNENIGKVKSNKIKGNIWQYKTGGGHSSKDKVAFEHPAIFPERLVNDHIISWTNKNEIALDPMSGSGTTLKMAEKLGRRWIGIEISEKYCEIAKQRIKAEADQIKMF